MVIDENWQVRTAYDTDLPKIMEIERSAFQPGIQETEATFQDRNSDFSTRNDRFNPKNW